LQGRQHVRIVPDEGRALLHPIKPPNQSWMASRIESEAEEGCRHDMRHNGDIGERV